MAAEPVVTTGDVEIRRTELVIAGVPDHLAHVLALAGAGGAVAFLGGKARWSDAVHSWVAWKAFGGEWWLELAPCDCHPAADGDTRLAWSHDPDDREVVAGFFRSAMEEMSR